jgi:hypothetical protein
MGQRRRTALATAFAVVLVLPLAPTLAGAPPRLLAPHATWELQALPPAARAAVLADVDDARPAARRAIDLVDGSVAVDLDVRVCGSGADSCSYREPDGAPTPWRIHLGEDTSSDDELPRRFIVLHEIGHAVYGLVLDAADRAAFDADVARTLHGKPCRRVHSCAACAPIWEVFADEFARWAGGFGENLTGYDTPPLVTAAAMTRLIDGAVAKQLPLA